MVIFLYKISDAFVLPENKLIYMVEKQNTLITINLYSGDGSTCKGGILGSIGCPIRRL